MQPTTLLLVLIVMAFIAYQMGMRRSLAVVSGRTQLLHSLPLYHGSFAALAAFIPAFLVFVLWQLFENTVITNMVLGSLPEAIYSQAQGNINLFVSNVKNLVDNGIIAKDISPSLQQAADYYSALQSKSTSWLTAIVMVLSLAGLFIAWRSVAQDARARNWVEKVIVAFLVLSSSIAILTTIGIIMSVLFESMRFFGQVPFADFMFGTEWSPQTALRADQVGSSGSFGAIPLFVGTLLISLIAMLVATPIGLMSAIYLSEYASSNVRSVVKPLLEILAGIPTVVYGFFAALTVAPAIRGFGESIGLDVASESALAAGLVMGIMIIPFISSLSDDVINAVPQSMRDGAYALGATQSETIRKVVFPAALPGVIGGILLGVSRAIGETMIVVMAAGLAANLTLNPLEAVTTVTVQIVTLLTGDQEFDSAKTLAAFALGLLLFVTTLILNVIALYVVRKYREEILV
ncbi:MAG: phosphate ABC transporter permease subunit PstC [Gammaproteobacteria bacterium]|nr:MAG: phosphate ABC transporter permease subunit PstC [Gammaproteobacteria bacterium]